MNDKLFSVSSVAIINLLGMVTGFLINSYLAYRFGASFETDAYLISSMVPAFFIYMMGFDSLKGLARTLFIDISFGRRSEDLSKVFSNLFNLTFVVGLLISIIAILISSLLVKLMAPGASDETHALAISLCRVMIPSILFIGLANLNTSILNMWHKFFFPSLAIFSQKVSILAFLIALCSVIGIHSAAIGMLVGSLVSLFVLSLAIFRSGIIKYSFCLDLRSPLLRDITRLFSPLLLLLLVMQVNGAVTQFLGSFFPQGTITRIGYAKTVASVMIPVVVTPVLSVYLNDLCGYMSKDRSEALIKCYNEAFRVLVLLLAMLITFQLSFSRDIVALLFRRGAFSGTDAAVTSQYYILFLIGIPFQSYGLLCNYLLLAAKRTDLILMVGIFTVCTNALVSTLLSWLIGSEGIVIGTSSSWLIHALIFHLQARKVILGQLLAGSWRWVLKLLCLLGFIYIVISYLWNPVHVDSMSDSWNNITNLLIGGGVVFLMFIALSVLLGIDEVRKVTSIARKRLFW